MPYELWICDPGESQRAQIARGVGWGDPALSLAPRDFGLRVGLMPLEGATGYQLADVPVKWKWEGKYEKGMF